MELFLIFDCEFWIVNELSSGPPLNLKSKIKNLAILTRLGQVVVDHPAPVFLCLGNRRVAALFVAADFVFRVKTLEYEFAGGNEFGCVRMPEIKRNKSRFR